jgi:ubiquinone/menaquinone biosynthesis C-methylase UbiE
VECDLPEEIFPVGADRKSVGVLNKKREALLDELQRAHGLSMWDIFDESGIGQERNVIAKEFVASDSPVLDVATGRGYFGFACARRGSYVTAVDIMDGEQRVGWWNVFSESSRMLGIGQRVCGIRANSSGLPTKSRCFGTVCCIHAIRNFLAKGELEGTIKEAHRVLAEGRKLIVAECSKEPESEAEEVYLAYLKLRLVIGWEADFPDAEELELMLEESGFSGITRITRRFSRDYAPVEFPSYVISNQPPKIREEHGHAEKLRSRIGIKAPPVIVISGVADTLVE